jgi:hypothetical protein
MPQRSRVANLTQLYVPEAQRPVFDQNATGRQKNIEEIGEPAKTYPSSL